MIDKCFIKTLSFINREKEPVIIIDEFQYLKILDNEIN